MYSTNKGGARDATGAIGRIDRAWLSIDCAGGVERCQTHARKLERGREWIYHRCADWLTRGSVVCMGSAWSAKPRLDQWRAGKISYFARGLTNKNRSIRVSIGACDFAAAFFFAAPFLGFVTRKKANEQGAPPFASEQMVRTQGERLSAKATSIWHHSIHAQFLRAAPACRLLLVTVVDCTTTCCMFRRSIDRRSNGRSIG